MKVGETPYDDDCPQQEAQIGAEIIDFREAVVDKAFSIWRKGNRDKNVDTIGDARGRFKWMQDIDPLARYLGGVAKIQLRANSSDLGENLIDVFQAMEKLFDQSDSNCKSLLKPCRDMLYDLALDGGDFKFSCLSVGNEGSTLDEIKKTIAKINAEGPNKDILKELYLQLVHL